MHALVIIKIINLANSAENVARKSVLKAFGGFLLHQKLNGLMNIERKNSDERMRVNGDIAVAKHHLTGIVRENFKNFHQTVFVHC